jgi:hypothetical protein
MIWVLGFSYVILALTCIVALVNHRVMKDQISVFKDELNRLEGEIADYLDLKQVASIATAKEYLLKQDATRALELVEAHIGELNARKYGISESLSDAVMRLREMLALNIYTGKEEPRKPGQVFTVCGVVPRPQRRSQ